MDENKLNRLVELLKNNKKITFRLYNAFYTIIYKDKEYTINQLGIDKIYTYKNITTFFKDYYIYGSNLKELFNDIEIIE